MKKNLLLLGLLLTANQTFSQVSECLPQWGYRTPLTVSNPNATVLPNHQVNVTVNTQDLIGSGKMNVDGSDMRFAIDCCTPVCYWIEGGLNTPTTSVWINVASLPANGDSDLFMYYGNATASDMSDATCVFDVYDDFDNDALNQFTHECGTGTESFSGGELSLSWSSDVMYLSNNTLPLGSTYMIESNIAAASGNWPGIYSMRNSDTRSYGMLMGSGLTRISVASTSISAACDGHNWASAEITYSNPVGLWSLTWKATGDIIGDFPSIGAMTSTDVTFNVNDDLRVAFGGISGGTGAMTIDWIRARKYAAMIPTFTFGTEEVPPMTQVVSISSVSNSYCPGFDLHLDAGAGFVDYNWSNSEITQEIDVNTPGSYIIIATDAAGCMSADTIDVTAFIAPVADYSTVVTDGDVDFTNTSTNGDTYSWDFGDGSSLSTDENPSHTFATNNTYNVCLTVTSSDGCEDEICYNVIVSTIGLNTLELLNFSFYPNPVQNELNVVSPLDKTTNYELVTVEGKVIQSGVLKVGTSIINVESFESGIYILKVSEFPEYGARIIVQ